MRSALMWQALQSVGEVETVVVTPYGEPYVRQMDKIRCVRLRSVFRVSWKFSILQLLSAFPEQMDWAFLDRSEILERLGCTCDDYDCVVVRSGRVATWTAAWKIAPLYLDLDDLPSEVYQTTKMPQTSRFKGKVHLILERWWERFIARQCAGVWLAYPEKYDALPKSGCKDVLRNIGLVPSSKYRSDRYPEKAIVTIGTFGHEPNRAGIDWFLLEVWPQVLAIFPNMELRIAGRMPEAHRALSARWASMPGVRVMGFVDDLDTFYESALCTLAAVKTGSGTSVKVIESALFGRTCFATPFATRGLDSESKRKLGVVEFKTADDFVKSLEVLLSENVRDREHRSRAIQSYANKEFTFAGFKNSVADFLFSKEKIAKSRLSTSGKGKT